MNILLIIIGSLLLIIPNISFFDIVPDFIGFILITLTLKKTSFICYDIKDSYAMFRNLIWANAARIPFYIAFLMLSRDMTLLLLFNFIFSCVEVFFLIRGFSKLFDGFAYLALREDGDPDQANDKTAAVFDNISKVRILTYAFIIIRAVCALAPDLSLLSSNEYGTVTAGGIASVSRYHAIFIVIGFIVSLIFGVLWFLVFRKYLSGVKADVAYLEQINAKYDSFVAKDPFAIVKDALFLCLALTVAGSVFSLGLRFDGINLIPQFIGALFFVFACLTMMRYYPVEAKRPFILSIVYSVSALISWIYQYVFIRSFFLDFLNSDEVGLAETYNTVLEMYLQRSFDVIYQFIGFIAVSLIEGVCLILFLLSFYKLLQAIINEHTGSVIIDYDEDHKNDDVTERTTGSLLKLLKVSTVFGIIAAVISACESFLCILFPPVWIPELIFKALWMITAVILISRVKSSVKTKYFL